MTPKRLRLVCDTRKSPALEAPEVERGKPLFCAPYARLGVRLRLSWAGVKQSTLGPDFSLQALTNLRHCAFLMLFSQARQVVYNLVALETGQPKSPSGANEQY